MKTLYDATILRSHIISTLEQADILNNDNFAEYERKKNLLTYVIVGGGFSGVETVGEINEFIKESIKLYYHNIDISEIKVILIGSGNKILPEMEQRLGKFAQEELRKSGVEIILSNKVKDIIKSSSIMNNRADKNNNSNNNNISDKSPLGLIFSTHSKYELYDDTALITILNNDNRIMTYTVVWTAGVVPENILGNSSATKDKKGRLVTNEYLQVNGLENVFAAGDCASILDSQTGRPCPPTAQHAIRQGEIAGTNIISKIKTDLSSKEISLVRFGYKTRGTMATIGKRNGVAVVFGFKVVGFIAWIMWRTFYLKKIPARANRFRVLIDWTLDLIFNRDIARLKTPVELTNPTRKFTEVRK